MFLSERVGLSPERYKLMCISYSHNHMDWFLCQSTSGYNWCVTKVLCLREILLSVGRILLLFIDEIIIFCRIWSMVTCGLLLLKMPLGGCSMLSLWPIIEILFFWEDVQTKLIIGNSQLSSTTFQDHCRWTRLFLFPAL